MAIAISISPTVDFAFKMMLGSPEHAPVTIHFLNAILGGRLRITQVKFLNPFLGKVRDGDKLAVLDILATDNFGRQLNIEIQTSVPAGLRQRLAFYDARLYVDQMKEGEQYHELRPAIVICVLTKPLFPVQTYLHTDFRLRDEAGKVFSDDLQIHTLELTKLNVTRENLASATPAERWAYFLRYAETMTEAEIVELFPEPEFVEAAGVLEVINKTPEQLHEYRSRLKLQLDEAARLEYARDEGRQEGEAKGRQEGEAKGRQEGEQKGELIGRITMLQEILSISQPSREELSACDLTQLTALAKQLQQQLSRRGQ
jgi:predicted transposase/invertase (TIGR01784 family)